LHGRESIAVKHHFTHYARWGGFPEVCFAESEFEKRKILREYLDAMFFKDMVERYRITNVPLLDLLFDKVFSSFSTKLSITAFYKQYHENMPFSKDILFNYYRYMQQSMLMYEVKMFAESSYKRMRNPAKIYPADIGLCRKITSVDTGRILEAIVFLEFKRRGGEVFYFTGRHECDFVVKTGDAEFIPYQVCADLHDKNREREIEGLKEACEHLSRKQGFLLTDNEEDELSIDSIKISVLPVWKWILQKT
jgi:predicted AAA+ superfamily ATPase